MSFVLEVDDELSLRLVEPHHAEELYSVVDANRDHLARWLPWSRHTQSPDDTRKFAEQSLHGYTERKLLSLSVLERGWIVGGTGWTDWKQGSERGAEFASADIGYWLARDAQGKGIMTRCVRALIDYAFHERNLFRLTIRCEPSNARSCAVPKRLGFTLEGTLRHVCRWDGRWVDHDLYAMLADE
jgi:ribosomal-protein-serine acetyltransferase